MGVLAGSPVTATPISADSKSRDSPPPTPFTSIRLNLARAMRPLFGCLQHRYALLSLLCVHFGPGSSCAHTFFVVSRERTPDDPTNPRLCSPRLSNQYMWMPILLNPEKLTVFASPNTQSLRRFRSNLLCRLSSCFCSCAHPFQCRVCFSFLAVVSTGLPTYLARRLLAPGALPPPPVFFFLCSPPT